MRAFSLMTSFAAVAALGLVACLGTDNPKETAASHPSLDDKNISYALGLAKASATAAAQKTQAEVPWETDLSAALEQSKSLMRQAGVCEGLISVVDDFLRLFEDEINQQSIDISFSNYPNLQRLIRCSADFVAGASDGELEQLATSLEDYRQLSQCICQGSGSLFGDYSSSWQGYAPASGSGQSYSPSNGAVGNGYAPSGNAVGNGYRPSSR